MAKNQTRQISEDQLRDQFDAEYRNSPTITWEGYLRGWNAVGQRLYPVPSQDTETHTETKTKKQDNHND